MTYIYQKTEAELFSALREKMIRAGIANTYPDAVSNVLNEFITEELYALSNEFNSKVSEYSLTTASEDALDRLVNEMYGMSRFAASKAVASRSIKFSNSSLVNVEIPEGTLLSSGESFDENGIVFETTERILVPSGVDAFGSAIAITSGSSYNVGSGRINQHELETNDITVTNLYPIINGSDLESDEDFRARALRFLTASASYNSDFMKLELLEVPGVMNIRYMQGYNGLGTIAVFATTAGNKTNIELKNLVESRLSELKMLGDSISYEPGVKLIFDIEISVTNTRNFSNEEISQLKSEIRQLIANEFVAAKTKGEVNLSSLDESIKGKMRSSFAFTSQNTSGSVFKKVTLRSVAPNEMRDIARPAHSVELASPTIAPITLEVFEIPEIGNLDIVVELIL